jgi:itaconate CoA-transferase
VAAPLATRHLADWGARVIKIERLGTGDFARAYDARVKGLSSYFVWLNRSKESVALDLKRKEAAAVVEKLIARADVFIHNLAPGAVERLGFSTRRLRRKYPRLTVCEISGYGTDGPYRDRRAYDLLIQAESGLLSITGTEDTVSRAGISAADIAAGMYAHTGILTALVRRATTGKGSSVEISMLEALGEWMSHAVFAEGYGAPALSRTGPRHAFIEPYGPFRGSDGTIYLGVQNEREWQRFCADVLQYPALAADPRFATNPKRVENRAQLVPAVEEKLSRLTVSEIELRLEKAEVAFARLNSVSEFSAHPQLQARRRWRDIDSAAGKLRALLPPVTIDSIEPVMGAVPEVGEHTESVLEEIGYKGTTIAAWKESGII